MPAKKAVAYVRVSSKEQAQEGYSPQAQKRTLWEFAHRNGFLVKKEFEEAETAKSMGRKAFNAMLEYVREHEIEHILVEKTDRLHRNFHDYVKIEDLVEQCNVTIHFVKEAKSYGKDATSSDRLEYGMKTLLAKHFIDNLREETKKGTDEKVRAGEYPGKPPLGYINQRDPITRRMKVQVDEKNKPVVQEMYRLYATGLYSFERLINTLEQQGYTQDLPPGRKLNKTTVSKLLHNPFYIGKFRWNKDIHDGVHETIVELDTWRKVQDVLRANNVNKQKKHNTIPFIYKGLFACGECGRSVTAEEKKQKYVYYRCTKYQRKCTQKPVNETKLHTHMLDLLSTLELSDKGLEYVTAALKQSLGEKKARTTRYMNNCNGSGQRSKTVWRKCTRTDWTGK